MVLRPTVLRYKGKAQKIDSQKMERIKQQTKGLKKVENMQIVSKAHFAVGFAACLVFGGKQT